MANTENIGKELLEQMAQAVGTKMKQTVALKSAQDVTVGWRGDAIHPQQNLETIHLTATQEAARKIRVDNNPDAADQQQEAMEQVLARFYASTSQPPAFLNEGGKELADSTYVGRLSDIKARLEAVEASLVVNASASAKDAKGALTITVEPYLLVAEAEDRAEIKVTVIDGAGKHVADGQSVQVQLTAAPDLGGLTDPATMTAPAGAHVLQYTAKTSNGQVSANFFSGNTEGQVAITASVQNGAKLTASAPALIVQPEEHNQMVTDTQKRLGELKNELMEIYKKFSIRDKDAKTQAPLLKAVEDELTALDMNKNTLKELKALCTKEFKEILKNLQSIAEGLAQIQMLFSISAFYLFRLLVPFSIVADKQLPKNDKRNASSELTDILNNGEEMQWVRDWLKEKMRSIAKSLESIEKYEGKDNVFFYLKGGRALFYLLKDESHAQNDWDTAIVINPELPVDVWYETFNKVHNIVLRELRQAKEEFFVEIHKHQKEVEQRIGEFKKDKKDKDIAPLPADLRADHYIEEVGNGCKAELIDIGIPRRDTIEATEQWHHYHDPAKRICNEDTANIWIPNHLYFIDEYIVMAREALAGISPVPHKTNKRIDRLHRILTLKDGNLDKVIAAMKKNMPEDLFPKSKDLKNEDSLWKGRIATVLLDHFMASYQLKIDPGLAEIVDAQFKKTYDQRQSLKINDAVLKPVQETDGLEEVLRWVAVADALSGWRSDKSLMLEKHLQNRADFFGFGHAKETFRGEKWSQKIEPKKTPATPDERRRLISALIKSIYTYNDFLFNGEEMEYQIAVGGSLAAYLHADAARLEKSVREAMDPVSMVDSRYIHLFVSARHRPCGGRQQRLRAGP